MTFEKLTFEEQAVIAMKRKNITLTDISKEFDISLGYVSDILKGNRSGGEYRAKIAEFLEISKY